MSTALVSPQRSVSHRWFVLAAGFAANAAFSAAISGLPAAAVLMREQYALSTTGLGIALSAVGLGIALSELPWGVLTDKLGDRRVLLCGLSLTVAVLAWMALFEAPDREMRPSLASLTGCLALLGLVGGSVNGSSGRAVMAWFAEGERGLAMSIRQTALPVGGAMGALLVPMVTAFAGFRATYAMLAAACLGAAVLCWAWLRAPAAELARAGTGPAQVAVASPLRRPQIWRMVLGVGILCVAQISVLSFIAVFLHDVAHLSLGITSAAMVVYQIGAAALRVWSGAWTDRHRNRRAYLRQCSIVVAVIFGVLAVLTGVAGGTPSSAAAWAMLVVTVLGGMAASCWHGVAFTELATCAGAAHVGTALGMGNTFAFSSYFLTPLMIPLAVSVGGWPAAWWLVAACALSALPLFPKPAKAIA